MHNTINHLLNSGKIIITDGAWGTQLQTLGLKKGTSPDAMNLTHPNLVEQVAANYVNAGSNIILTNTFGANEFVLSKFGMQTKVKEINIAGVEISRKAAKDKSLVFASMGPSGQLLMSNNEKLKQQLESAFSLQAKALAEGGADAIVIETMTNLLEAELAIKAAKTTGLPVIACAVFDSGKNKDRTMMGDTIEKVVDVYSKLDVDVLGTNCGQGITGFIPVCTKMRECTELPLWMKPNAGLPVLVDGKTQYNANPSDFALYAEKLASCGANFIGGCCGTSPEFIQAISKQLG